MKNDEKVGTGAVDLLVRQGLRDAPEGTVELMKAGLQEAARSEQRLPWSEILRSSVMRIYLTPVQSAPAWFGTVREAGMSPRAISGLNAFVGFVGQIVAIDAPDVTTDLILASLERQGLINSETEEPARSCVETAVRERDRLEALRRRSAVSTRGLPLLWEFYSSTDLKVDFDGDDITLSVPVLVVGIETNASDEVFRFQMTVDQVEAVIERLQTARKRLQVLEESRSEA